MLELIQDAQTHPVDISQIKAHLRLDHGVEDDYLMHLNKAATQYVENYLGRSLIKKTWKLTHNIDENHLHQKTYNLDYREISLPWPPLLSIVLIEKLSAPGTKNTPIKRHMLRTKNGLSCVVLPFTTGPIEITYKSGYGENARDIPAPITQAILMKIACLYENREGIDEKSQQCIDGLLSPYRIMGGLI